MPLVTHTQKILDAIANGQMDTIKKVLGGITFIALAEPNVIADEARWQIAMMKEVSTDSESRYVGGTNAFCHRATLLPCLRWYESANDLEVTTAENGFIVSDLAGVRKRISVTNGGLIVVDPVTAGAIDVNDIEVPAKGYGLVCKDANGVYWRHVPQIGQHVGYWDKKSPTPSDLIVTTVGKGFVMKSANGTRWRITPSITGFTIPTNIDLPA